MSLYLLSLFFHAKRPSNFVILIDQKGRKSRNIKRNVARYMDKDNVIVVEFNKKIIIQ